MANFDITNFYKETNLYLIPPYIQDDMRKILLNEWEKLNLVEHVFILSSGTSDHTKIKSYALSKKALITNANSVNKFLETTYSDTWLASLSHYHVGGLSIFIRASEAGSNIVHLDQKKWNALSVYSQLASSNISYASFVPTQLYDLVCLGKVCPSHVKGIFIGGDFLSSKLLEQALYLKYPIIQTYGMTEACSQIASSYSRDMFDGYMKVFDIHKIINSDDNSLLNSQSLYTSEIRFDNNKVSVSTPHDSHIKLQDNIDVYTKEGIQFLRPVGRKNNDIKIKGRLFSSNDLRDLVESIFIDARVYNDMLFEIGPDERDGHKIIIYFTPNISIKSDIVFHKILNVLPKSINIILKRLPDEITRTLIGKPKIQGK